MKCFLGILLIALISNAHAELPSYIQDYRQRQENKGTSRWTLADWMATRQKVALMDQWLALNSSANVIDFYLYGSTGKYDYRDTSVGSEGENQKEVQNFKVGFFVTLLGMEGEYEALADNSPIERAFVSLRLLGSSLQSTSLVLKGGQRKQESDVTGGLIANNIYGADLTLYLVKSFGLQGHYSVIAKAKDSEDNETSGSYFLAQAFLEAKFLRVAGGYFEEALDIQMASSQHNTLRAGWLAGVSLHW